MDLNSRLVTYIIEEPLETTVGYIALQLLKNRTSDDLDYSDLNNIDDAAPYTYPYLITYRSRYSVEDTYVPLPETEKLGNIPLKYPHKSIPSTRTTLDLYYAYKVI